jgi:hypothetical protein
MLHEYTNILLIIRAHLHLAHTCLGGRCQGVQVFVILFVAGRSWFSPK